MILKYSVLIVEKYFREIFEFNYDSNFAEVVVICVHTTIMSTFHTQSLFPCLIVYGQLHIGITAVLFTYLGLRFTVVKPISNQSKMRYFDCLFHPA